MEPIVPTPEERISRGNQGHKAARATPAHPVSHAPAIKSFRLPKNIFLPALLATVLIAAVGGLYAAQQSNLSRAENILAGLDQVDLEKIRAIQELQDSPASQDAVEKLAERTLEAVETLGARITTLEQGLERQSAGLDTLRQQIAVASTTQGTEDQSVAADLEAELSRLLERLITTEGALEEVVASQDELRLVHKEAITTFSEDQTKIFATQASRVDEVTQQLATLEQRFSTVDRSLQQASADIDAAAKSLEQQSQTIASLEKTISDQKIQSEAALEESSTQLTSRFDSLRGELEAALAQSSEHLQTVFISQLQERTAPFDKYPAQIAAIEKALSEQPTRNTQLEQDRAALTKQVGSLQQEWRQALNDSETNLRKQFTAQLEEKSRIFATHNDNLDSIETTLMSGLNTTLDKLDALEKYLTETRQSQRAFASQQQLASNTDAINQKITSLNTWLEQTAAATKAQDELLRAVQSKIEDDNQSSQLLANTDALKQQISALNTKVEQAVAATQMQDKLLQTVQSKMENDNQSSQLAANTDALKQQISALNTKVEQAVAATQMQDKLLQTVQSKMENDNQSSQLAANTDALKQQISALNTKVEQAVAATQTQDKLLRAVQGKMEDDSQSSQLAATTDTLKQQITALNTKVEQSLATVQTQEKRIQQVQSRVEEGLSQTANKASSDSSQFAKLQTELTSHAEALEVLRARDNQLASEINASKSQLQTLHTSFDGLQQGNGGMGVNAIPATELENVQNQIRTLARHLDATQGRLDGNEAQVLALQEKITSRLAQPEDGGANPQEISAIKETIQLLKGHHPYTKFPPLD